MQNFYNNGFHEDDYFGMDGAAEARRFEERLSASESFFVDTITLDEIYEYYRSQDQADKALGVLRFALQQYPDNPEFYYKKASIEYEQEQYTSALRSINDALRLAPTDSAYLVLKSQVLQQQGQQEHAYATLKSALPVADDPGELYYQLGVLYQEAEQYDDAIEYFDRAYRANPELEEALTDIVYCYEMQEKVDDAIDYCNRQIDNNPYSSMAWYHLGQLYQKAERFEQAVWAFDYAIVIQSDFTSAYYGKACALIDLRRYDRAIQTLLNALVFDKNDIPILLTLGEAYECIGDYRRARSYYTRCTELYADLAFAWFGIGSTLDAETRYYEAIPYYKKAVELNPEYVDAWLNLADCEYFVGNEVSAFEALRTAIDLDPTDLVMWRDWAARLHDDNKTDLALALLDEGLRQNKGAAQLLYQYAAYAFKIGRSREAFVYLENALIVDHAQHELLHEFCPNLLPLRPIQELIAQYAPRV